MERAETMVARRITPRPSASKRSLGPDSPLLLPSRAVEGLLAFFDNDAGAGPAQECAVSGLGTGTEAPTPLPSSPAKHLERSFLFVDVSGFTAYVARHGEHAAIEVLTAFRSTVREISARRGVRVGKWLGDGVMLVGIEPDVVVAAAGEMQCQFVDSCIDIHAGVASGPVLLYEGDDYIGKPVNLAARLCDAAGPGEILALLDPDGLPGWIDSDGEVTVRVFGMGDVSGVHQLQVTTEVVEQFRDPTAA